jgi:hypothetical protein
VLHEFYRPFFHRGYVTDLAGLDQALQRWTGTYNKHRPNHGDYTRRQTRHPASPLTSPTPEGDLSPQPVDRKA